MFVTLFFVLDSTPKDVQPYLLFKIMIFVIIMTPSLVKIGAALV